MTYTRVIPRDLFNEANLLKCYGRLWLKLEEVNHQCPVELVGPKPGHPFYVEQDESDGSTFLGNVTLRVCPDIRIWLARPLNSRDAWPFYATWGDEEVEVFTEEGELTKDFLLLLRRAGPNSSPPSEEI